MNQRLKVTCLIVFLVSILIPGCKKTDTATTTPTPISLPDSLYEITRIKKIDLNDYDIVYTINPPRNETFEDVKIHWSTSSNFEQGDSILIFKTLSRSSLALYSIKRLKQASTYYVRLSLMYKNKRFYSITKEFEVGGLKVYAVPTGISREVMATIKSTFSPTHPGIDTSTRVYLDDIRCDILITDGQTTSFIPPFNLESRKYVLRFERNGLTTQFRDSIEVFKGKWTELTPPVLPAPGGEFTENGLGFFGTCYSNDKGYIVPGMYFHELPYYHPEFGKPGYILEFDGITNQWSRKMPTNPRYFDRAKCYYANNSIYVLGGSEMGKLNQDWHDIQRMLKFDVNTLTWHELDSLPYPTMFNLLGFELNNEFYIGLGIDRNYGSGLCCGVASKKFWKYNPNTNLWTQLPDFPGNYEYFGDNTTAFTIGNKGYMFYGDPSVALNASQELWEFNPVSNSWTQINLPATGGPSPGGKYQIFSHDNKAYFLTSERYQLTTSSTYQMQSACLEFDIQNGSFKRIAESKYMDIMRLVFKSGNKFVFHSDALGMIEDIPNRTHQLIME